MAGPNRQAINGEKEILGIDHIFFGCIEMPEKIWYIFVSGHTKGSSGGDFSGRGSFFPEKRGDKQR